MKKLKVWKAFEITKAGYTSTLVACGWAGAGAGAVIEKVTGN